MEKIKISIELEYPKELVEFVARNELYEGDDLSAFASDFIKKILVDRVTAPFVDNVKAKMTLATDAEIAKIKENASEGITIKSEI